MTDTSQEPKPLNTEKSCKPPALSSSPSGSSCIDVARTMSAIRVSQKTKYAFAIAVNILAMCVFLLVSISAWNNAGSACDSSDDVLKRCVLRSNTLSPFRDASQCPCIAFFADCRSIEGRHDGLGVLQNSEGALDELQYVFVRSAAKKREAMPLALSNLSFYLSVCSSCSFSSIDHHLSMFHSNQRSLGMVKRPSETL